MRRQLLIVPWCVVGLSLMACKGQEVTVFDMPMPGGSSGAAGSSSGGGGAAGSAVALGGTSSGGDAAGQAGLAAGGATSGAAGSAGAAGVGGMPPGTPCIEHTDCPPGWLCEKPGCEAQSGVCEPRPVFLPPQPAPVCGCDGVTYWNDDIRRQFGTTLATLGECEATACSCEVGADCMVPYASCSHLISRGEECGHGMGACWVLPPKCVPTGDPMVWQECKPPDSPDPPPPCVDTCLAIASERPHAPPHHDACP